VAEKNRNSRKGGNYLFKPSMERIYLFMLASYGSECKGGREVVCAQAISLCMHIRPSGIEGVCCDGDGSPIVSDNF